MARFDTREGENYGSCKTCGIEIPTHEDSLSHMSETTPEGGGSSHTITITNPSRQSNVESEVDWIVDDAISEAAEKLARLVWDGDAMREEVTEALKQYEDFAAKFEEAVLE